MGKINTPFYFVKIDYRALNIMMDVTHRWFNDVEIVRTTFNRCELFVRYWLIVMKCPTTLRLVAEYFDGIKYIHVEDAQWWFFFFNLLKKWWLVKPMHKA